MDRNQIAIGCLPSDILNHILKYLPLRDAVRTSILSKEWRYKWLTTPYLVFDHDFERLLPQKYKSESISIINQVLAHHKGPIINFTFECEAKVDGSIIQMWLKLLSYHPIEDFTLSLDPEYLEQVPKHLCTFDCLKHLSLSSVTVRLPPVFKGFSCLRKLFLSDIEIDSKDLNMFVSKCPALEILDVCDCYHWDAVSLVIDAPNLKSFLFDGKFKSFLIENTNIEEIGIYAGNGVGYDDDIGGSDGDDIGGGDGDDVGRGDGDGDGDDVSGGDGLLPVNGSNLINIFGRLPSVRKLTCDGSVLMFLAEGVVPDKLPNYLNHMTTLELVHVDFVALDHVTCILCLIRSSPNLQKLEIMGGLAYDDSIPNSVEAPVIEYLKAQEKCEVSLGHSIKNVTLDGFGGLKAEMAFAKVILLKSMQLRKLIIKFPGNHAPKIVSQVVIALTGFHRASSEAIIEFC